LLGQWALQLVENQLAMLLEYAQRPFERMEQRLSNLQGVANIQRVLDDHALASDVGRHFGNLTVGLGKMAANHRSKDTGLPDCEKSKPRLGRCTRRSAAMARAGPVGGEGLPTSAAARKKSVRDGPSKPSPLGFLQMPAVILPRQPTNL